MRQIFAILLFGIFSASAATAGVDDTAAALLATGKVDDAIAMLHGQIASSPDDAMAHNLLCRAYFSLGQWDRGIGDCEKAVSLEPEKSQYHLWLGRIYGEKADKAGFMTAAGLARRVRTEFEEAVRLSP
ncbi:MAG TPA: tetratricopeptide repeat protein, partial [Terriglobales bacterium]